MTLKDLRNKYSMTQLELAIKVGVGRSTIAEIERGTFRPSLDVADKIALCFNLPIEDIFPQFKRRSPYPKNTSKVEV